MDSLAQVKPLFPESKADAGKGIASLQQMLEQCAQKSFCQHFKCSVANTRSILEGGPVFDHWMSLILMAGPGIKITAKAFFNHISVAYVIADMKKKTVQDIPTQLSCDFMKEFCNLLGGNVKRVLLENSISVGLSLPLLTRGFDEAMSSKKKDFSIIQKITEFTSGNSKVILQTEVSITDPGIISLLADAVLKQSEQENNDDDMEFL